VALKPGHTIEESLTDKKTRESWEDKHPSIYRIGDTLIPNKYPNKHLRITEIYSDNERWVYVFKYNKQGYYEYEDQIYKIGIIKTTK